MRLSTHQMEEADQMCQQVAFIVQGKLVANDTPRNLKLVHGQYTYSVTLEGQLGQQGNHPPSDVTLSMDSPGDQAKLAEVGWRWAWCARSIRARRPSKRSLSTLRASARRSEKGSAYAPSHDTCHGAQRRAGYLAR